jgi:hypothetical protein
VKVVVGGKGVLVGVAEGGIEVAVTGSGLEVGSEEENSGSWEAQLLSSTSSNTNANNRETPESSWRIQFSW